MKVGIQYFAKGCLYSFYFTNPILSPETKVVSYIFSVLLLPVFPTHVKSKYHCFISYKK